MQIISTEAFLIYTAMLNCISAFVMSVCGYRRLASGAFFAFFVIISATFIRHTVIVSQVPLRGMYEVFLFLSVLIYPISFLCSRFTAVRYELGDIVIAILLLIPCGFVFEPQFNPLPQSLQSPFFIPHVAAYMLAYLFMAKGAIAAAGRLLGGNCNDDAFLFARLGFPFMAAGLILGSIWAKSAWGRYWGWDPKELWALATIMVYAAYFHFNHITARRFQRIKAVWLLIGIGCIVCTMLWVNLSSRFSGLHTYTP